MSLSPWKKLWLGAAVELGVTLTFFLVGLGVLWVAMGRAPLHLSHDVVGIVGYFVVIGVGGVVFALWSWLRPPTR